MGFLSQPKIICTASQMHTIDHMPVMSRTDKKFPEDQSLKSGHPQRPFHKQLLIHIRGMCCTQLFRQQQFTHRFSRHQAVLSARLQY